MRSFILAILASYGISGACSCIQPGSVIDIREHSPITVHARILANETREDSSFTARTLTVEVLRDFSREPGEPRDTLVFWTNAYSAACGVDFPVGMETIMFGDTSGFARAYQMERPGNAYMTGLCSGNVGGPGVANAVALLDGATAIRNCRSAVRGAASRPWRFSRQGVLFQDRFGADGRCAGPAAQAEGTARFRGETISP